MFTVEDFVEGRKLTGFELEDCIRKAQSYLKVHIVDLVCDSKKPTELIIPFRRIFSINDIRKLVSYELVQGPDGLWEYYDAEPTQMIIDAVCNTMEEFGKPIKGKNFRFHYHIY